MTTTIDVSAQFGGRDAAQAVLPHFRAMKLAIKGKSFAGFPCRQLAFILRVDGEVNAYGQSGPGHVQFDGKGAYVSVDIGITREDLAGRGVAEVSALVAGAIVSSAALLKGLGDARLKGVDWGALEASLQAFSAAYKAQLAQVLSHLEDVVLENAGAQRDELLPIAASADDMDLFVMTNSRSSSPGVVIWFAGQEVERFPNFDEFFATMVDYNRAEVARLEKSRNAKRPQAE